MNRVRVGEEQEFTPRDFRKLLACPRFAGPSRRKRQAGPEAFPGTGFSRKPQGLSDPGRGVVRLIIKDDDFQIWIILAGQGPEAGLDPVFLIARRDEDGNERAPGRISKTSTRLEPAHKPQISGEIRKQAQQNRIRAEANGIQQPTHGREGVPKV